MSSAGWGILGTGNMAASMAAALAHVPGATLSAVASRDEGRASAFAAHWNVARAYGSEAALLADPRVDIVYISTPNALHKDSILAALAAGKHVLCEKPMTLGAADSAACFAAAETAGCLLMEALWTAFFPAMARAIDLVQSGAIGTPRMLTANFVSKRDPADHPNLFDPDLGGGARNDLGIYPVAAALLLAGPVAAWTHQPIRGATGVDEMFGLTLAHENGALSLLACGFRAEMPIAVRVTGDDGAIEIAEDFHCPQGVTLHQNGTASAFDLPSLGKGYAHEAIAFQAAVHGGDGSLLSWKKECTIAVAEILETGQAGNRRGPNHVAAGAL